MRWSTFSSYSVVDEEGNFIGYLQQEERVNEEQEERVDEEQEERVDEEQEERVDEKQEERVKEEKKSFWKRLFGKIY